MGQLLVLLTVVLSSLFMAAQQVPRAEVFGGYSYLRNSGNSFNGWEGQATANLGEYFGLTTDFSGHYRSLSTVGIGGFGASADQRMYNFLFGPTVTTRFSKYSVFGHALFGAAHSSLSAGVRIPVIGSISTGVNSANAFAMALGGGLDFDWTEKLAIRPVQIDYLYTRFNSIDALSTGLASSTSGHQNSFRYSAGIVVRF